MSTRAILVTGATGKQGSAVIDALIKANTNLEIIALTRNAQSPSAKKLQQKSPKINIITGNLDAINDVFQRAKEVTRAPIWGVFSVQIAIGDGQNVQSEERQGKALVDAALSNGVSHFVYSSVDRGGATASNTTPTYVPHFASKYNVEQHLFNKAKGSDMTWTVLRPVAFLDNLTADFFGKHFSTTWQMMLAKDKKLQMVATSDIGWFAAEAFVKPEAKEYRNESISLAGDELTFGEFKTIFERKTGQKLPTTFRLVSMFINWMVKELGTMWRWFRDVGYGTDIARLRAMNPALKDFATWLETESAWKTR
ncbi:NAD(P)-binding protein [Lentithecium fluviatile CBS 122367]|uniref:NAD(P)-binding protein n=1 Tax=Lentithecium fluviatile CBS 122367 TaxID=1168545 RepID=A0A6G1IRC5_9PLEO|nr:NAD(P)-binding protein [Lentithecium fluviatile CBS 122367]